MNIVYASDDNFADIMGVSIVSLLENNKQAKQIKIFILDDSLSDSNKENLTSLIISYNRSIFFAPAPNITNMIGGMQINPIRFSSSVFSRLLISSLLPETITKALYIDCDTLIRSSIEELYNENTDNCHGAGVLDCISSGHKRNIGLNANDNYFNAGVLLTNLDNWRCDNIQQAFIDFIIRYNGKVPYDDQGVINGTIAKSMKIISPIYNSTTVVFDFSTYEKLHKYRKPENYYTEAEYIESVNNPVIVHFSTSFLSVRPWVRGCKHPYAGEWLKYKTMTPWSDVPLKTDNRSLTKKFSTGIYHALPESIAIKIAGGIHSRVIPMVRGKNK